MFQYAAARALALRLGGDVVLDLSWFSMKGGHFLRSKSTPRSYALSIFNLPVRETTEEERAAMKWVPESRSNRLWRKLRSRFCHPEIFWVEEPHFHYWPGFESLSGSLCLHGYWNTERYFESAGEVIRQDFTFPSPPQGASEDMFRQIKSEKDSVSVHIRRGDYVADRRTNRFHGVCSPTYYRTALEALCSRCAQPSLFIFSDEPAWVRRHFDTHGLPATVVDLHRDTDCHHDMHLMSVCDHHVIANSSFSWWAAWLGRSDGLICAPQRWFISETALDVSDLCPATWLRMNG